ncbi:MAG: hemolysin III family protein [Pseudomonadales bacterium]|nr:hemolysin III family protein [Pseudomonadales bacterium]
MNISKEVIHCFSTVESLGEKLANAITHGVGLALSIFGFTLLIVFSLAYMDHIRVLSATVYGTTLMLVFLASTLYHSAKTDRAKRFFRTFDHCAIYLLIAGTYTPILLLGIKGELGNIMLGIIWSMALLGCIFKIFFWNHFERISLFLYIGMGWLAVVIAYPLVQSMDFNSILLLLAGGVIYTAGTWFFSRDHIPYNHATWHVFVLGGSACHFFAIYHYVIPFA